MKKYQEPVIDVKILTTEDVLNVSLGNFDSEGDRSWGDIFSFSDGGND